MRDEWDEGRDPDASEQDRDERDPRLRTTRWSTLVAVILAGLVLGRSWRLLAGVVGMSPPRVTWAPAAALLLGACLLGAVAWSTRQAVRHRRSGLRAYQAVNRLVLGKASALAGAFVAGGYLGYALAWLGSPAVLASERVLRSGLAGLAAVAVCGTGLLLERACRVRGDEAGT